MAKLRTQFGQSYIQIWRFGSHSRRYTRQLASFSPSICIYENKNIINNQIIKFKVKLSHLPPSILQSEPINHLRQYNNNNNSQCRSRFCGVWGDPAVGNLTPTGISTHREVDSLRPTKPFFWKRFIKKMISN